MLLKKNITIILLVLIIILASILRLQYLNKPLQRDEVVFYESVKNLNIKNIPIFCENCLDEHGTLITIFNYHTQLFITYFRYIVYFFDLNETVLRFSIVIFSLATVVLIYFLGNEMGGKKLGLLSAFFLAINRLHVEHSQIIDIDGSFFTFFLILNIFFILKWFKTNKRKYFIFSVISSIILILVKEPAVLIFFPLFLYFYKKKKINKFLEFLTVTLSLSIIFILLFNYFYSSNFFDGFLQQINKIVTKKPIENTLTRVYQFIGITTWDFTLPFVLISLFSIFYVWKEKKEYFKFLLYVVLSFVLFYTVILGLTRYFVPIIPVVCLLVSNYIINLKIKDSRKSIILILSTIVLCYLIFYFLKIRTDLYFLSEIKTNFSLIIIPYLLCTIPLTLYFLKYRNFSLILLIGMSIGYNIFFAQEAVNPLITPDYSKAITDATEFIKNSNIKAPIVTSEDISFHSNKEYYNIKRMNKKSIEKIIDEYKIKYVIYKTNDLVIQQDVKEFLEKKCVNVKSFYSKNVEILKVFKC